MTTSERLRHAYQCWQQMPSTAHMDNLLYAAQPVIRATVTATLNRHADLRDDAESLALQAIWRKLTSGKPIDNIVALVRHAAKRKAWDALKRHRTNPSDGVNDLEETASVTIAPASKDRSTIDLQLLSPINRAVAHLFSQGASQRNIKRELHISGKTVIDAMQAIRDIANHQ